MRTFQDNAGRTWLVGVNVTAVKRARALVGVDLYAVVAGGPETLNGLLGDIVKVVDVLYVVCQDQADKEEVSDEDFGRALGGDALQHAADALVGAIIDFFPQPRVRDALRKVAEADRAVKEKVLALTEERLARIDVAAEAESALRRWSAPSTSARASPASTPAPSPSANSS